MFRIIYIFLLFSLIFSAEYEKNKPSVFLGKDDGWWTYVPNNTVKELYYKPTDLWSKPDTSIFIGIASFRDKLCPITLYNLFTKAQYPERIVVGVVQQNEAVDLDCVEEYCNLMKESHAECKYVENIRVIKVLASTAKGPTWGRAKLAGLLQDEEFCLQIDSHMDFVSNWDTRMMEMWGMIGNEYAVISTYVADAAELKVNSDGNKGTNGLYEVPHLCMVTFSGSNGLVRNWGTKCMREMPEPKLTNMVWGAGLSFSRCHAEKKVPYDPHTPFIFDGEEFSRALRFWTWGYDIYTPHRVYIVHNYKVSQADPTHSAWGANQGTSEGSMQDSVKRLKTMFHMPGGETDPIVADKVRRSRYGLGDRRSIDQAIAFSGIDTKNRVSLGNRCGKIDYVPFKEHPLGPTYVPKYSQEENPLDVPDSGSIYYVAGETPDLPAPVITTPVSINPLSVRKKTVISQPVHPVRRDPVIVATTNGKLSVGWTIFSVIFVFSIVAIYMMRYNMCKSGKEYKKSEDSPQDEDTGVKIV